MGEERTRGERAADAVARNVGSWRFIIAQTTIVLGWIALNLTAYALRWDPYPFILLNLCFSTQAAYAAPILQMSSNRRERLDSERTQSTLDALGRNLQVLIQLARNEENVQKALLAQGEATQRLLDLILSEQHTSIPTGK